MDLSNGKKYRCPSCPFKSKTGGDLKKHQLQVHSEERPFPCPICPFRTKTKGRLTDHLQIHNPEKQFKCPFIGCDYETAQKRNLVQHLRIHTDERPFICRFCDARFRHQSTLNKHIRTYGSMAHQSRPLNLPGIPGPPNPRLSPSTSTPTAMNPIDCTRQVQRSLSPLHLLPLTSPSTTTKPFEVRGQVQRESYQTGREDWNGGLTGTPLNLKINKEGHTMEKPLECPEEKELEFRTARFVNSNRSHVHMQLNHVAVQLGHVMNKEKETRPYQCTFCQSLFLLKRNLMAHMKIHERIRGKCGWFGGHVILHKNSLESGQMRR